MTTIPATGAAPRKDATVAPRVGAHDRMFYGGMAVALAATVLAGFGPTYYLTFFARGPSATLSGGPFTALVHVHAAVFTAWVLLFIVQTALISSRRIAVHRRLGVAGAVLAAAMVVAGTRLALATAARGAAPAGVDPLAFLVIPLTDMVLFALFVGGALALRRDSESHKRLMLLAYISIMVAAVARLPGVLAMGPPVFFGMTFVFILLASIYDFVSRGRVHRIYLWGGGLFLVSVPARLMISGTSTWRELAQLLTS